MGIFKKKDCPIMADEAPAAPTESAAPESEAAAPKKKKMLLIISVLVAIVGILVAVGVVFFMGGEKKEKVEEEHTAMPAAAIYEVPEFNLSLLSDDPNAQHFVKMKLSLELTKTGDAVELDKLLPRLQDDWGGFLRQMRMTDLQGSANLQRLKEGLLRRANQSLEPLAVKAVYIRELLVQ
jgi:flagellar FliL protein